MKIMTSHLVSLLVRGLYCYFIYTHYSVRRGKVIVKFPILGSHIYNVARGVLYANWNDPDHSICGHNPNPNHRQSHEQ